MKKLFSKTVAALLSVACVGSLMTASFDGKPLFETQLIAANETGSPNASLDEETGILTVSGIIKTPFDLSAYKEDKRVKEVILLDGTVLPENCNQLFCRFEAEKIDVSRADSSHVTDMADMFCVCPNLKYLNIENLDTSNVTNMDQMFGSCPNLKSIDLKGFNTSKVTSMINMFKSSGFESLDLSSFDTSNVTTMACMFQECTSLESVDLSSFNTINLESMDGMFQSCTKLKSLDFSNFDTSNLKHFHYVFLNCENLEEIIFGNFDTSKVTDMDYLFHRCFSLKELDLSSFDTSNVTTMLHMFDDCQSLETIYVSDKWTTSALNYWHWTSSSHDRFMFFNCHNLKGGNGTAYDWITTDSKMACIDTPETPGYLTYKAEEILPKCKKGLFNHIPDDKNWKIKEEATCQHSGVKETTCKYCGETFPLEIPALGHKYKIRALSGKAPTFYNKGEGEEYCIRCGETSGKIVEMDRVSFVPNGGRNTNLSFDYNGNTLDGFAYPTEMYNGKTVVSLEFTTNYPWSVTAPNYICIHNKETCNPITNGDAGKYSLYIWIDSDLYWEHIIGPIKDQHYSEITSPQSISFNIQDAVYSYDIDEFHINGKYAHEYFGDIISEIKDFATDKRFDIIDYICGRVITGESTKTIYYKENKYYLFESKLKNENNLSIDYSVIEPANTNIEKHLYMVTDDIFYTVPFDLYSIAVASVQYKTAYRGVLDFSGGSAGISVHIYPGTILELDQNGFCTWCYNPTNDNDYTYWYFYRYMDRMVRVY